MRKAADKRLTTPALMAAMARPSLTLGGATVAIRQLRLRVTRAYQCVLGAGGLQDQNRCSIMRYGDLTERDRTSRRAHTASSPHRAHHARGRPAPAGAAAAGAAPAARRPASWHGGRDQRLPAPRARPRGRHHPGRLLGRRGRHPGAGRGRRRRDRGRAAAPRPGPQPGPAVATGGRHPARRRRPGPRPVPGRLRPGRPPPARHPGEGARQRPGRPRRLAPPRPEPPRQRRALDGGGGGGRASPRAPGTRGHHRPGRRRPPSRSPALAALPGRDRAAGHLTLCGNLVDDPGAPGRGAGKALRLLVVWCPDWPVQATGFPYEAPVAVLHAGRVVACTPAARAEGVAAGLRRREAQRRCPGLVLVAHDPDRDARAFEPVVAAVETVAPKVEILQPGACAFPAGGAARYHGGERELVAKVAAATSRVLGGHGRCRVGIAAGVFAAGLAARHGVIVPAGQVAAFLAPFGPATLDRPDLADLLTRLGLRTLGQVAALPRADLASRFGAEGVRAHRLARGEDERPRNPRRPPPDLRVATNLEPPAQRVEAAAFAAKKLADELAVRLRRLGLACLALRVEIETEHGERLARVWRHQDGFAVPSRRGMPSPAVGMAERVRWQLDGWLAGGAGPLQAASQPSGAVSRLELAAEEVAADRGRQLGFWGEEGARRERAVRAIARVQGLLGPDAVRGVELRGGRGPADRVAFTQPGAAPSGPWKPGQPPAGSRAAPPTLPGFGGPGAGGPSRPGGQGGAGGPSRPGWPGGTGPPSGGAVPRGTAPGRARAAGGMGETAPWPGQVPAPAPAVVHPEPLAAEVVDATGAEVVVGGRRLASAPPARLKVASGRWTAVTAWAGPWPVDERWWDPSLHRRLA